MPRKIADIIADLERDLADRHRQERHAQRLRHERESHQVDQIKYSFRADELGRRLAAVRAILEQEAEGVPWIS